MILIEVGTLGTVPKGLEKGTGRVGNWKKNRDHAYCSIVEIGLNTEKSTGNPRRLAVNQTPVKYHQYYFI